LGVLLDRRAEGVTGQPALRRWRCGDGDAARGAEQRCPVDADDPLVEFCFDRLSGLVEVARADVSDGASVEIGLIRLGRPR